MKRRRKQPWLRNVICCPVLFRTPSTVDVQRGVSSPAIEQKEKSKSEEQLASYAREYIAKVENELQKIGEGVLALMDKKLVPSPSTDESKAFYYKMKSDYYRYFAEFATGETSGKAGEDACDACVVATEIAEKDLVVTNPVRLAMALSSVVTQRQIPVDQVQKTVETSQQQCIDKVVDQEALTDNTKVAKLVVDKWFVDRAFGFGKVPTGEIVFIHANAVFGRRGTHDRNRCVGASRER